MPRGFEPVETDFGMAWRLAEVLPRGRVPGPIPPVPHGYLDTETTGLSGGTGTQVFAAAVCRPVDCGLELVQLFLPEPAGEAAFLSLLRDELAATPGLATYNGSRFDLPLLRTRWVMARMPGDLQHPAHTDLLTLTRALLRQRLESCALRVVEERLLGFEREGDLPGALVPEAYLRYLRLGWAPQLELALEHNRQDVVSLFYLHARLLLRLAGEDSWMESADWLALGRHLLRAGRRADGWRALRRAVELADGPPSALAGVLLARGLARRGLHAAAERLLAELQYRLPDEVCLAVLRARLLERSLDRPAAAHAVVSAALARLHVEGVHRIDLDRRLARLERRLSRRGDRLPVKARRQPAQRELFLGW
ncbi:MAG: ribonuclease H-like domain-containing protein [Candidatus Dormibacteraeota bacterium]|nr:ribonuclease H-like domain-containing protein [Candidatus Dormibacteraeota bacterium]